MPAQIHVSATVQFAERLGRMIERIEALERMSGRGGGSSGPPDWTGGYPLYDDRYVNITGDVMTESLTIKSAVEALRLVRSGGSNTPHVGFYDETVVTRYGYIMGGTFGLRIVPNGTLTLYGNTTVIAVTIDADSVDLATTHKLAFGATTRQMIDLYGTTYGIGMQGSTAYFRSASTWSWHRGGVHSDAPNDPGGTGVEQMRLGSGGAWFQGASAIANLVGNSSAYVALYAAAGGSISAPGTRSGYMGFSGATALLINNEVAAGILYLDSGAGGMIILREGGVEQARLDASGIINVGRTSANSYYTAGGIDIRPSGQFLSTCDAVNSFPWLIRIGAAYAAAQRFLSFRVAPGGVGAEIGSITMATTTTTAYNTTSHGPFKGDVTDLDDDDALARLMLWRPIAFRWKLDEDGLPAEDGTPTGDVHHGFIAQEMFEVNPHAVTPGYGTWDEHLEWKDRWVEYAAATAKHDVWVEEHRGPEPKVPENPGELSPFSGWQGDWTGLVPDLSAAMQALVRKVEAQAGEIAELRALVSAQ
jgi:hypothetical protein